MHASALVTLLAVVGTAHAQSWTYLADVSHETVVPGEEVTVTISAYMEYDTPFVALSAHEFDALNLDGGDFGELGSFKVLNHLDELISYIIDIDGDSMLYIPGGQLTVFGPFTSDNPIDVFQFTWVAEAPGDVLYETEGSFAYIWAGDDKDSAEQVETDITNVTFGWTVVPAPPVTLLGLAVLRRRRR